MSIEIKDGITSFDGVITDSMRSTTQSNSREWDVEPAESNAVIKLVEDIMFQKKRIHRMETRLAAVKDHCKSLQHDLAKLI